MIPISMLMEEKLFLVIILLRNTYRRSIAPMHAHICVTVSIDCGLRYIFPTHTTR